MPNLNANGMMMMNGKKFKFLSHDFLVSNKALCSVFKQSSRDPPSFLNLAFFEFLCTYSYIQYILKSRSRFKKEEEFRYW